MIFVTVGTTQFSFSRLLQAVDRALVTSELKEKLVAQVGINKYQFVYSPTKTFFETPFNKMIFYLSHARVVISHGGVGATFLALKYAKSKPLIIPRKKEFGEHVDSHQVELARFLEKRHLIKAIFSENDCLKKLIYNLKYPPHKKENARDLSSQRLIKKLIEYVGDLK